MRSLSAAFFLLALPILSQAAALRCEPSLRCVFRCEQRYLDSQCAKPGPDFCGPGATCVPFCEARYLDGGCQRWGADHCELANR